MIKKPDRAETFKPKCLLTDRQPAYTATGFIVPCCWVDNPWGMRDDFIKRFYDPKMHIDNNESVMEIMNSDLYNEWWDMLINRPEEAPDICKKYCGSKLDDKVTKHDTYISKKGNK